jgi:hypothetical protein
MESALRGFADSKPFDGSFFALSFYYYKIVEAAQ